MGDLSNIPMLAERQVVAAAVEKFHDIGKREWEALAEIRAKQESIRDELRKRHMREEKEALAALEAEEARLREPFQKEMDALKGYPDLDDGWMMHGDFCGVYCCEISGLPLRADDDLVEHDNGYALADLQN